MVCDVVRGAQKWIAELEVAILYAHTFRVLLAMEESLLPAVGLENTLRHIVASETNWTKASKRSSADVVGRIL